MRDVPKAHLLLAVCAQLLPVLLQAVLGARVARVNVLAVLRVRTSRRVRWASQVMGSHQNSGGRYRGGKQGDAATGRGWASGQ